ncbi:MAG: hypothetical protein OHK0046_08310 [Anaerolineae bacterium]
MPINLEIAIITLYEDSSLTEEITDEPAQKLLKWGEAQVKVLAEKTPDDEIAFDDNLSVLMKLIKSMNRFTARRHEMTPEEIQEYLQERILERAQRIGLPLEEAALTAYRERQATLDESANVQAMMDLMSSAETPAPAGTEAAPPQADAPAVDAPMLPFDDLPSSTD